MPNNPQQHRPSRATHPQNRRKPRRRIKWRAVFVALLLLCLCIWGVKSCCSAVFGSDDNCAQDSCATQAAEKPIYGTVELDTFASETPENILDGLPCAADRIAHQWDHPLDSMPDDGCLRLQTSIHQALPTLFNDSNHVHLEAARAIGINPIRRGHPESVWEIGRPLVKVASCEDFYVAPLSHSYPYLVPKAAKLLHDIGKEFRHRLQNRGGGDYRIKVTSLLRTPSTVGRLRRVNRNSVDSSAHVYATTFDISFSRFVCDRVGTNRTCEDLKLLLAEVLLDMRAQGRCYVKYERKQSCFHITTR